MAGGGQEQFNVNTAAAQGQQAAMLGAAAGTGYQAPTLAGSDLTQYQNPYQSQVIDTTMDAMNRSRQMALNDVSANATSAGAWGGARHGVAEAETNRAFADSAAQMAAGLNSQGFQNAQQGAMFDANNDLASEQMRMNASGQLGSLAGQAFNMGNTINQQLMTQGTAQQALQQQLIDLAKQQYAGFTSAPQDSLQVPLAALGASPIPQSTTQTSTSDPGLLGMLSGAASILAAPVTGGTSLGGLLFS